MIVCLIVFTLCMKAYAQTAYQFVLLPSTYSISSLNVAKYSIGSTVRGSDSRCISTCAQLADCVLVQIQANKCYFFNIQVTLNRVSDGLSMWYRDSSLVHTSGFKVLDTADESLTNYWPIINGDTTDQITGQALTSNQPGFDNDRTGAPGGSIRVSDANSYWTAPPGVYFSGPFTVMAWIQRWGCNQNSPFLLFEGGGDQVMITLAASSFSDCRSMFKIGPRTYTTNDMILYNVWTHIAAVYDGQNMILYWNGVPQLSGSLSGYTSGYKTGCYFGTSSTDFTQADFDEIKIYSRGLSPSEVLYDYQHVSTLVSHWTP